MTRLPALDPAELPESTKTALTLVPFQMNIVDVLANAPTLLGPMLVTSRAVLTELHLEPRLRELAALRLARNLDAEYIWTQHVPMALAAGISGQLIEALDHGAPADDELTERDVTALSIADLVTFGKECTEDHFAALAGALTPREIVELILVCGLYYTLAKTAIILQVDIDHRGGQVHEAILLSQSSE